jgi:DNA mismatch repair protein MutS
MPSSVQLTPMLRQYLEVKADHGDAILMYRMGDFYEMFFEDAVRAAPILEVTLTARNRGKENEAPMCGVPHHAVQMYLGKLLRAGLKVAICDQVEDPAEAKGLVKREVTRVITPGTISDPELLEGSEANYLASLEWNEARGGGAFLDISTGRLLLRRWARVEDSLDDLALLRPQEILHPAAGLPQAIVDWMDAEDICRTPEGEEDRLRSKQAVELVCEQMGTSTLKGFGLDDDEPAVQAAAAALRYARETQQSDLSHVKELRVSEALDNLVLDATTVTNLEIFRSLREGRRHGSLLAVLDKTVSPPGGRLLREWLKRPLRDPAAINDRLDAVAELLDRSQLRGDARELLRGVGDLERLVSRAVLETLTPREAAALRSGLENLPGIMSRLSDVKSAALEKIGATDVVADLAEELRRLIEDDPPASLKEGGVIKAGVDEQLDRHRSLARDSKQHILALQEAERERTGIASLKVRFNKVFGYYLEVTKANQHLVPESYIRKQTLVNAERYVTPELKELEEQILAAEQEQLRLEDEHFRRVRRKVAAESHRLLRAAESVARLDVLSAFAECAARNRYTRPEVCDSGGVIRISEGRHPVVEKLGAEPFVPNDTQLGPETGEIVILTGPNMGGKSTYLRQTALIVLMAQAGGFVPAASASISTVDRIFTRVGASDDLSRGESTFMVEMIETAKILHQATASSLVILDEVGRGTATFDGLSLAWAIVEHLHEHARPKTIFATHYHELTELAAILPSVVNRTMAVREWADKIVFLRRVKAGSSDKSYGLHVARLAGIPATVIERASQVLQNLEAYEYDLSGKPRLAKGAKAGSEGADQMMLFAPAEEVVASLLREVDLERLSPLAALNLLHSLKARVDE